MKLYLKIIASALLALGVTFGVSNPHYGDVNGLNAPQDYGWVAPEPGENELYGDPPPVASGKGKVRLLYRDWERATGYVYIPRHQVGSDCVGQSTAAGLDMRLAVQALEGMYKTPQFEVDASSIYGLSRIEIGNTNWVNGSKVGWAMQATSEYGLLFKQDYLYAGYDLSDYDPRLSKSWGRTGLPSVLERIAELTPVVEYYKVTSYEEVRDAINAGYSVVVGSNVGFSRRTFFSFGATKATRDRDGFLTARGTWKHAQAFVGVDDKSRRKGVCCLNSWGSGWVSGPTKLNNPPGSYWIDDHTVTRMASQGDAYAIVQINYQLNYRLAP